MSFFEASVTGVFRAGHALRLAGGGCEPTHDHEWSVTATFRNSRLDETMGVVVDFVATAAALNEILSQLDGGDLNSLEAFADGRPSAERVAEFIAKLLMSRLAGGELLHRLAVTEAAGCVAAYYPASS